MPAKDAFDVASMECAAAKVVSLFTAETALLTRRVDSDSTRRD